jgi:hypothetical protein
MRCATPGAAPRKKMPILPEDRVLAGAEQQVGAIDPVHGATLCAPQQIDQRHAVGRDHPGFVQDLSEIVVPLRLHDDMGVGDADELPRAQADPLIEAEKGLLEGQNIDLDAENVVSVAILQPRLSTSGAISRWHGHRHSPLLQPDISTQTGFAIQSGSPASTIRLFGYAGPVPFFGSNGPAGGCMS